jgi:putative ABC transport system permease protein
VAASLLLVLLLGGIVAGAVDRVTYYIRTSPADLFISQGGVRTMHMSVSELPAGTLPAAGAVPGVAWAAAIGFASGSVAGPSGRMLSYLLGYDTDTGNGGPQLVEGRPPGLGEAVLDELAAEQLGIDIGGRISVLGTSLRIVGLSVGGTSITNTTVFVARPQFAEIRGDRIAYVLVRTLPQADPGRVAEQLRAALPGTTVQTRRQFADSEARVATDMSADLLRLMSTLGLLVAMAVIALGLLTATLARLRDFAILKALGCTSKRLVSAVVAQVLWTITLAVAVAAAAAIILSWLIPFAAPTVQIKVTASDVAQTAAAALVVGIAAALWPLHRIAAIDAATAFRETR